MCDTDIELNIEDCVSMMICHLMCCIHVYGYDTFMGVRHEMKLRGAA